LKKGEPLANRILRVDHGGENGAVNIYKAQAFICVWRAPSLVAELNEFRAHEESHRRIFGAALEERGVRQGIGYKFCGIGGFVLGIVTGLLGRAAIAGTTEAVERVVLRHLTQQLEYLRTEDQTAYAIVASILAEEQEHHDKAQIAAKHGGVLVAVVDSIVAAATEAMIWLGMHR
jgi:ubiquinone biosynthesis monooxygenase Coq7